MSFPQLQCLVGTSTSNLVNFVKIKPSPISYLSHEKIWTRGKTSNYLPQLRAFNLCDPIVFELKHVCMQISRGGVNMVLSYHKHIRC